MRIDAANAITEMNRIAADREGTRDPKISGNRTSETNPAIP
jgi:hypothetical protein